MTQDETKATGKLIFVLTAAFSAGYIVHSFLVGLLVCSLSALYVIVESEKV